MAYGFSGHIGLAKEVTFGTGVAATDYVEALSESLSFQFDRFETKNIIGSLAEPDDTAGVVRVSGDIVAPAHPVSVGHFLKGFFHNSSVSIVVSSALWTTTFETSKTNSDFHADVPNQPYTFEIFRDVTSSQRYSGCVINALGLSFAVNQDVRMTAGIIGKSTSVVAKTSPTFPGSPSKPFTFDTVSLSIAGAATALMESLNIQFENQFEGIPVLNADTTIAKVRRTGFQTAMISGTLDFSNLTEYANFVNQTEQQFIITCTKANSFLMKITLPRVVYHTFPMGISGRERQTVDFSGKAYYHTGSANAVQIALTTVKSNF